MVLYLNILQRKLLIHGPYNKFVFIYQFIHLSTYLCIYSSPYLFIIYLVHQEFINVISY